MRILLAPGDMRPQPHGVPLAEAGLEAGAAAVALGHGWARARPGDDLRLLPLPDGGAGSAAQIPAAMVDHGIELEGAGPTGQQRPALLVHLGPASAAPGTWVLDAAAIGPVPSDPGQARREAEEGSTAGYGQVLRAALEVVSPGEELVIGLARTAAHDGGAGLIDAMGGAGRAARAVGGRRLTLALADTSPLGGLGGTGRALSSLAGLSPEAAQEADRRACAAATALAARLGGPGGVAREPLLATTPPLTASTWGTGAGGGSALVLRALGARALPGARVLAGLLGLDRAVEDRELVLTAVGEAFDVLEDSVPQVVGRAAEALALPAVLVAGRAAAPRGELAAAGICASYGLEDPRSDEPWAGGGTPALTARLEAMGERLARTWSR
ncbi:MAG: glycerate kinase [Actinomyces sp.]|uniref:glycerate kinase n=1 Tax=Actinomyces sp. TaxID=29317 RepID=UPI0026DBD61B|nr:glycerate kinase [Actinomyces sp.]MDO4243002.1 glycerate kinase [Actinomyces sp.]